MLVATFTHMIRLAAFSSLLAFLFSCISRPILQKECPIAIIDVLWLLVLPLLLANHFTNGCPSFFLPQTVDQVIKLRLPVEILLQKKKTVSDLKHVRRIYITYTRQLPQTFATMNPSFPQEPSSNSSKDPCSILAKLHG